MPNALGLLGEARMQATPRNKLMGLLADALTAANDYAQKPDARMPGGKANPVLGLLADGVSLNSLATTANRASYGEPLTNKGKANVPFLKPETADALMMAPLSPRNALAMMGAGMADTGAAKAAIDIAALKGKFPGVDFWLTQRGDIATLDRVVVPKEMRGQGVGSEFMAELVKAADADGARIGLTPSSDLGGNKARLTEFYKRYGFVPNKGKNRDFELMQGMVRQPEQ